MRRLILLRHAKSDWPQDTGDHERPLAERGREQAPLTGRYLASEHLIPDLAVASTARRAQETWALVRAEFSEPINTADEARLYGASPDMILALARNAEDSVRTQIMVGHNPGFHETARLLAGHGDRYALARLDKHFPTCAIAILDFAVENWGEIAERTGRLDRVVTPKTLGGVDAD